MDKERHHERIVNVAARMVREKGLDGVSIADLMKDVGLTHGGFYRHFTSRDELVNEAIECALGQWVSGGNAKDSKPPRQRFESFISEYLSVAHRDSPGTGCVLAALSGEARRGGKSLRRAFTRQVKMYLDQMGAVFRPRRQAARRESILALSALVGAVALARAVDDDKFSREILMCTGEALRSLVAKD